MRLLVSLTISTPNAALWHTKKTMTTCTTCHTTHTCPWTCTFGCLNTRPGLNRVRSPTSRFLPHGKHNATSMHGYRRTVLVYSHNTLIEGP